MTDHNTLAPLQSLLEEHEGGQHPAPSTPRLLPLSRLHVVPEVFQPREATAAYHVRLLVRAIDTQPKGHLDPLLVWWSGKRWMVVDGHHRLEAYQRAAETRGEASAKVRVPVRVFEGSLQEARAEALRENSKSHLALNTRERMNGAWRLVCDGVLSKADTAAAAGVSTGQVGHMRKTLRLLQEKGVEDIESLPWSEAQAEAKGRSADDWEYDEDAEALDVARRLGELFGPRLIDRSGTFAAGLLAYSPSLCERIVSSPAFEDFVRRQAEVLHDEDIHGPEF